MNVWIIAPGEEASIWNECKDEGYIAIGWDKINVLNYDTKQELNKDLILLHNEKENNRRYNYLWDFGKEINIDDIVVARDGLTKIVGIGKISSNYISPDNTSNPRKDKGHKQIRLVKWLNTDTYTLIPKTGQFAQQTVYQTTINDIRISKYIKEIVMQEKIDKIIYLLENRKQIILQGPPGTGKTRLAKQMAIRMINTDPIKTNDEIKASLKKIGSKQVKLIQFHPSYSYEDFVRGIVAKSTKTGIEYNTENKVLAQMAKEAIEDKENKPYILIIDEINRANLSSVLGELIYALEYRNEPVESMYELEENGSKSREITLPSNLYIIGTMNTADRSIGHIDYAIRRRFAFENILADKEEATDKVKFQEVKDVFEHISPEFEEKRVMLGHSYFIGDTDELKEKLKYQVIPLLEEYVSDGVLIDSEELRKKIEKLNESYS